MMYRPATRASFAQPFSDVQFTVGMALDGKEITRPVVLRRKEATAHKLVLGLTGSGKSYLLDTLCLQSINQNVGCVYIDPHGDGCRNVLRALAATGFF